MTIPDAKFVETLWKRGLQALENIRNDAAAKGDGPQSMPRFTISAAAALVGRTQNSIRNGEKDGRLPVVERRASNGHRLKYTLQEMNNMRAVFGTKKWRSPTDPVAIVAVQNFKRDVGKSAVSTHLAQYLAREGYRVLLIDCDSQASTTRFFNYVPDADIREDQTIYPFLQQVELRDIRYAIRPTHWDGLHLIPANLHLCVAEYDIVGRIARGDPILLDRLSKGI
ncbi:MAG TPA: AAA family ATPase [Acidocella sp.]|nr:AAA family ATPase [Acidocella sp.]